MRLHRERCWRAGEKSPFLCKYNYTEGKGTTVGYREIKSKDVEVPPYYPDIESVRSLIARHYNCLLRTDKEVGQIVQYLKQERMYDIPNLFLQ